MRVSKDKNDAAYDARERKVFIKEKEVEGWISADEFRRVVVMADGSAIFGDVYIERLPEVTKEECNNFANCPTEQFKETMTQFAASAIVGDNKTIADCDARFANSENMPKNPIELPSITETPKYGFAMGDRAKIKDRK